MSERYSYEYPNKPDSGFCFDDIVREGQWEIVGNSGSTLQVLTETTMILVTDGASTLSAVVFDSGTFSVAVNTRRPDGTKHPDMYARKFVMCAYNHFETQGVMITGMLGQWNEGLDMYAQFMNNLSNGQNSEDAARNTWTGGIATELGFSNVEIVEMNTDEGWIKVLFSPQE